MDQQIEAVFENGVFRPLQPVRLPEHHRVTLLLSGTEGVVPLAKNGTSPDEAEFDAAVGYQPLPLLQCKTIRVTFRQTGDLPLLPYPIEEDEADAFDEPEQA